MRPFDSSPEPCGRAAVVEPLGFHGRMLRIDVAGGTGVYEGLEPSLLRHFLGGVGLGTALLLREQVAGLDPLQPAAPVVFAFSPLVGSPLTTSAKFALVCKSPLTGRLGDALASSTFALAGKRAGCDALVVVGRAEVPSVLLVDDGRVRLEPAGALWGMPIDEAQTALRGRYGVDWSFACIGPAGERLVRFASVSHDGRHAGRGGSGAVLGAKNLKAIAVRGTQRVGWAQPAELVALSKQLSQRSFGPATAKYRELGTAANLLVLNRLAALPTRNFQQGTFAGAEQLSPHQVHAALVHTRASCAACTIGCEHLYTFGDARPARLEYENLFALGPLCEVHDLEQVLAASRACDALGLDTISTGGTIAFAMECAEAGLLDAPWLRFGEAAAVHRAIEEIGLRRTPLGDLLAEGSRVAAERLGGDAPQRAVHVKGLELPGYEPRAMQTMALGLAVGTRGADHNRSGAYEADFSTDVDRRCLSVAAVSRAIETEDRAAVMDSLILCKFLRGTLDDFYAEAAQMLRLTTGWDVQAQELRTTARRIVDARKWFNIQAGWNPAEDTLPARFLDHPLPDDPQAVLTRGQLAEAVTAYNLARGYAPEGWLTTARREELARGVFGPVADSSA